MIRSLIFPAALFLAPPVLAQDACTLLEQALDERNLPLSLLEEGDAIGMALRAQDTEECAYYLDQGGLETEVTPLHAPICEDGGATCSGDPSETLTSDT